MTEKLFYKDPYLMQFDAVVLSCEPCGDKYSIVLDRTAFYPEGGGQPADHGSISYASECCAQEVYTVSDVHEKDGMIIHTCDSAFETGAEIHGVIDPDTRLDHMQQHSGEHIVSGMICSRFSCDNVGFHMGADTVTIDYNAQVTYEQLLEIEDQANRYIRENHEFVEMWPDAEELKTLNYRSKKELTGAVRIAYFPGADMCACCGTHVRRSGEVGLVKILSCVSFKGGVRIELLCGDRAFRYLSTIYEQNRQISRTLSAKPAETAAAVERLKADAATYKAKLSECEYELFRRIADDHAGEENVILFIEETGPDSVRKLAEEISARASGLIAVYAGNDGSGYKYALIHKGADICDMIKEMNKALNGRGGGRNGFAQGNVNADRKSIEEFFDYCS